MLEVPHFASLRGREREIMILRSNNGETWREHTMDATDDVVQDILNGTIDGEGRALNEMKMWYSNKGERTGFREALSEVSENASRTVSTTDLKMLHQCVFAELVSMQKQFLAHKEFLPKTVGIRSGIGRKPRSAHPQSQYMYRTSINSSELEPSEELGPRRVTRILTTEFPQYFAIVTRVRQESATVYPEGGMLSSTVVPQVQSVFPLGALTKKIKMGLQVSRGMRELLRVLSL